MQQQRCFAEGAVATQTTVWDELGGLVSSDEGKRELAALRSTYVDIAGKLASLAIPIIAAAAVGIGERWWRPGAGGSLCSAALVAGAPAT